MGETTYRLYPYRWAVLGVFMLVNLVIQVLWISYAPITAAAAEYYGVSELKIGLFSMIFMIVFVPLSIPASWAIDRFGFRRAAGLGSILMAAFALLRGIAGPSYALALAGSAGLAAAQPLFLNAWTKLPAQWFPEHERATMVGLITLANLLGTALGMILSPLLAESMTIADVQTVYAAAAALCGAAFMLVAREAPPSPPGPAGEGSRALMLEGLKHALGVPSFLRFLGVVFVGMGLFNGIATWIEEIVRGRGFGAREAGIFGALLLVGGIAGAVILPALSDRAGKRRPFILLGLLASLPGLLGLAFLASFAGVAASAFAFGFFLTSVMPIGMQLATDLARPTPEGTSNGLVQLCGQTSVVFVFLMEALRSKSGSFAPGLLASALLLVGASALAFFMREAGAGGPGSPSRRRRA